METIKAKPNKLSVEETREILTPFAFKIDKSLFGISLAKPWHRGGALLIDLLFVAILSGAPGELLALLVAITLFNIGSKKRANKLGGVVGIRKKLLRVVGALMVFIVLIEILPRLFAQLDTFNSQIEHVGQGQNSLSDKQNSQGGDHQSNDFIKGTITLAAGLAISNSDCKQYTCWQQLSADLLNAFAQQASSTLDLEKFKVKLLEDVAEKSSLTQDEIVKLTLQLKQMPLITQVKSSVDKHTEIERPNFVDRIGEDITEQDMTEQDMTEHSLEILIDEGVPKAPISLEVAKVEQTDMSVYKGFAWLQGLIEDLGIGFGWAAFYFTMFTALWYGQTPGKKLFGIRVIQLDGTPLSVWDSFGRYGGYGAGIATGLLGFAQIYWDPNRQAIHDKISATIVVNDNDTDRPTLHME